MNSLILEFLEEKRRIEKLLPIKDCGYIAYLDTTIENVRFLKLEVTKSNIHLLPRGMRESFGIFIGKKRNEKINQILK